VLLDSYASVQDMETARDSRIAALEAQVNVTAGRISGLQQTIIDLEQQIGNVVANDREPAPELLAQLQTTRAQLLDNQRFLQARRDEQDTIRAQFAIDIQHYLELKGEGETEQLQPGGRIR
jgi:capsule polysaccharide export protein KpsE/RkpR